MIRNTDVQRPSRRRPSPTLRHMRQLVLLLTFSLATLGAQSAEKQSGVLQGTVSVSSSNGPNERMPGANLILTSSEPGKTTRSATTNDQGEYSFTGLTPGIYTLQLGL